MALIAMCCHDTEENGRSEFTWKTLMSLRDTVDTDRHQIVVVNQNGCAEAVEILALARTYLHFHQIDLPENIGTAKGINMAWRMAKSGQNLIKMDNDCVVNQKGWVDLLEEAIRRVPSIGIIGLKRNDLMESTFRNDFWKSELRELPHNPGELNMYVEVVNHVMGTCQMYNSALIDKIGGLYQMDGLYGFDDSLASVRSHIAGFTNCFLPYIDIDHIDPGDNPYQKWKEEYSGALMSKYQETVKLMQCGETSIYYPL